MKNFTTIIACLLALDIIIVLWAMLQLSSGVDTPHIAFWDYQIKGILWLLH